MSSRFIEEGPVEPAPHADSPATAALLLCALDVSFQPVDVQREAVAAWLEGHTPRPRVARELRQRGLAPTGV
ncbi:hypothetical protein [Tomitella fengzijianii]|uniref:hypothetical protein n=1 Tax=Tomitella fengzijianii TaxID=2597660 RepID=UPI00131C3D15|nr:hypothetical protein [Tomitella fengzijianii]